MPSGSWLCPVGVTSVQVEMGGSGAKGNSPLPQAWRGQGGGGGSYGRKKLTVVPGNSYATSWGAGTTFNAEPNTDFGSGMAATAPGFATNGGGANPGMDVRYAGGNAIPSDFAGAPGTGGGGGAGRNGAGGNGGIPTGGTGGSNSPSLSIGNGGDGGSAPAGAGSAGVAPSGGGGGMGGGGAAGADISGNGTPGWILIYDDTDNHGFDAYRPPIGTFGTPPLSPPVSNRNRNYAYIMEG